MWEIHRDEDGRGELFEMGAGWYEHSIGTRTVMRNCVGKVHDGLRNPLRREWSHRTIRKGGETVREVHESGDRREELSGVGLRWCEKSITTTMVAVDYSYREQYGAMGP